MLNSFSHFFLWSHFFFFKSHFWKNLSLLGKKMFKSSLPRIQKEVNCVSLINKPAETNLQPLAAKDPAAGSPNSLGSLLNWEDLIFIWEKQGWVSSNCIPHSGWWQLGCSDLAACLIGILSVWFGRSTSALRTPS